MTVKLITIHAQTGSRLKQHKMGELKALIDYMQ